MLKKYKWLKEIRSTRERLGISERAGQFGYEKL